MRIAAVQTVELVRPTDSGNTVVVEMIDGTGDRWTVLIPQAVARELSTLLEQAGDAAATQRRALGRS